MPLPGVTLKLAPEGAKREVRVAGPNVMPGYYRNPEVMAAAFGRGGLLSHR